MASDFIAIDVQGIDPLAKALKNLPIELQGAVVRDVSKYLLNVLRAYPPKKYVSRKAAFGQTFFTDKQRRWFFAALNSGELDIPYSRTQALSRGWTIIGDGASALVANETPYAAHVMGDGEQSRHMAMIGWKTTAAVVEERTPRINEIAQAAVNKAVKKSGL